MAKGKLIHIPADNDKPLTITDLEAPPSLETLQRTVGGYIELIPFFHTIPAWALDQKAIHQPAEAITCDAYCNEEGKLDGLPFNPRATALWCLAYVRETAIDGVPLDDVLVGDVAIVVGDGIVGV